MRIDQAGLNSLLSVIQPRGYFDKLSGKREGIIKKLNQGMNLSKDNASKNKNKQLLKELYTTDKQMQAAFYEEKSLQLRLERLKIEEITTSNLRKKDRILAEHESTLFNASMGKLISAQGKSSELKFGRVDEGTKRDESMQKDIFERAEGINEDIKESAKLGIAAAEVARRRRNNQMKMAIEAAAKKSAARREREKKRLINVTV